MKVINLTPENFVDLLVVCLFWGCWPPTLYQTRSGNRAYRTSWTTIDHILSVLKNLDLITDAQIKMVRDSRIGIQHQARLKRYCGEIYGTTQAVDRYSLMTYQGVANGKKIPISKLMRNAHLEITDTGVERAKLLEEKFNEMGLSKDIYLAEEERISSMFKTQAAHAVANKIYIARVNAELEEK